MGKRHAASGITENRRQLGTKAQRRAAGKGRKEFQKHPTELRCTLCGQYVEKLQQVKRANGTIVPGCKACAKPRAVQVGSTPRMPSFLDEPEKVAPVAISDQPALALPAPRMNAYLRPIRRQLALMVGPRPRHIPTGPAIALGPGDKPSPYRPDEIEKWRAKFLAEMDKALPLAAAYATADGNMSGEEKHTLNWNLTNAVQAMQHAAFVYANFAMAV